MIAALAADGPAVATALIWAWVAFTGLCVGSFLNVVIHRLPVMMDREERSWAREVLAEGDAAEQGEAPYNLVVPRSACPRCGHRIGALENIPVLSWLWLRGRCRGCGQPISVRYPLIELITAALTCIVVALFGFGWEALWVVLFTWALLAASVIDLDHQLLPDSIVLPLLWLGLLINVSGTFAPLSQAVVGTAIGYGVLWALYWAFRLATGREGMGYGDFKLLGAMGAWMGWAALPGVVLLSSLTGILAALVMRIAGRLEAGAPMPFGPFIAAAGWLAMVLPRAGVGLPGL